jgi:hypothetical protein
MTFCQQREYNFCLLIEAALVVYIGNLDVCSTYLKVRTTIFLTNAINGYRRFGG